VEIANATPVNLVACKAGVISAEALTTGAISAAGDRFAIICNNGTVSLYRAGALLATTTGGPTATSAGTICYEAINGATAAQYRFRARSFSECA
jgi:hypothetical protein